MFRLVTFGGLGVEADNGAAPRLRQPRLALLAVLAAAGQVDDVRLRGVWSDEVYVPPFPGAGGRTLVSSSGGREPIWSRDGRSIVYSSGGAYVAAAITLSPAPVVNRRDTVATGSYASWRFHPLYDIAPDGKHLLVLEPSQKEVPATVILNWANAFASRIKRQ